MIKEITMTKDYLVEVINESGVAEEMILRKDNTYSFETETPEIEKEEVEEACPFNKEPRRNPRRRPMGNRQPRGNRRPMETLEGEGKEEVKVEAKVEAPEAKMPRRRPQMNKDRQPQSKGYGRNY